MKAIIDDPHVHFEGNKKSLFYKVKDKSNSDVIAKVEKLTLFLIDRYKIEANMIEIYYWQPTLILTFKTKVYDQTTIK